MSTTLFRPIATSLLLILGLLLSGLSGPLSAAPEARTYQLNNRPATEVAGQIRELYPDGQVAITARGQQMVIRGEPQVLDEIGILIETMDVAPAQLRITVRTRYNQDAKSRSGGVSAHDGVVNIQAERRVTTTRRNQERSLVIQDGQSAHITAGQIRTVPIAIQGGRNPAAILAQVETRSGFLVSPQVISDQMIELNIMAFEEDPQGDIPGYETEAVMTIRRVKAGEWVELGSTRSRQAGNRSGIVYQVGGKRQDNQAFEVRVEVL